MNLIYMQLLLHHQKQINANQWGKCKNNQTESIVIVKNFITVKNNFLFINQTRVASHNLDVCD